MMRICILTQPLHTNYGGLLQAYALQRIVREMGHEVLTEDRRADNYSPLRKAIRSKFVRNIMGQPRYLSTSELAIIKQHTNRFIEKYIATTTPIYSTNKQLLNPYNFDGYIVGSDQVWRKEYSLGIENYFLDFANDKSIKMAYAASFGLADWQFSDAETHRLKQLASRFDLITVREKDAIELCVKHLGVAATQVVDPTLLLCAEDYKQLALDTLGYEQKAPKGGVVQYLLDPTGDKRKCADSIAQSLNLPLTDIGHSGTNSYDGRAAEDRIIAPPTHWISALYNAEYVVTDSFHGTLFAILFNKPFLTLDNQQRGTSRLASLLEPYGLSERMITPMALINKELTAKAIDYTSINQTIERQRAESLNILKSALE